MSNETILQKKIKQLEADLDVYKRIFSDTIAEKKRLEDENDFLKQSFEKQRETSEKQLQVSWIFFPRVPLRPQQVTFYRLREL